MKVTNWRKKLAAAIVAAGVMVPGVASAITVPDADFYTHKVPGAGYAYSDTYRPESPWVDDLGHNAGNYHVDDGPHHSNWLYNPAYSDYAGSSNHYRGAPRSGANDQAMHGDFHYSGQVLNDVFAADTTYTFSIYGQGDSDAVTDGSANAIYLYIFNGDNLSTFSDANALKVQGFTGGALPGAGVDFLYRAGSNHDASLSNWKQLSTSYYVAPGSPLIGQRIGIGFYMGNDVAVDDASLSAVPEPTTFILLGLGGVTLLGWHRRRD